MYEDFEKIKNKNEIFKDEIWICTIKETELYTIDLLYNEKQKTLGLIHVSKDLLKEKLCDSFGYYEPVSLKMIKKCQTLLDSMVIKLYFDAEKFLYENDIQPNCYKELFKEI